MALAKKDFEEIGKFVQENMANWLSGQSYAKPVQVYEIELRERMIRLEEELKQQRELMKMGFESVDKRFESVDKRFESLQNSMDKGFNRMFAFIGLSFTMITILIGLLKFYK